MGNGGVEEAKKTRSNKPLVVTLCVLGVLILGLIGGIVVTNLTNDLNNQDLADIPEDTSAAAMEVKDDIEANMETDSSYDLSKAEQSFKDEIANSDPELKIYLAISYANFIYDETGSADRAIEALKNVEQYVSEQDRVDYYVALKYFYTEAGDEESIKYYNELLDKIAPDMTRENIDKGKEH